MTKFRSPSRGGNLVHNLDFPGLGRGGAARRSAREAQRRRSVDSGSLKAVPNEKAPPTASERRARIYVLPRTPRKLVSTEAVEPVKELRPHSPALQDSHARKQIDMLERRLAKMARLLDQRDTEIVSRSRAVEDEGVASIYRDVQGLDAGGDEAKQKRELMSSIFEANVKLREMVTSSALNAD